MSKKKGKRFAVKWKNRIYKAFRITETKGFIIIAYPNSNLHVSCPKADGKKHHTFENGSSITIPSDFKITKNQRGNDQVFSIPIGPIKDIKEPVPIAAGGGFDSKAECETIPKNYELIDLEKMNYPNIVFFLLPKNHELPKLKGVQNSKTITVELSNIWLSIIIWNADH